MVNQVQIKNSCLKANAKHGPKKTKRIAVCHKTHSFEWCAMGKKKATTITCNTFGTVKNSLRRSPLFKALGDKNKLKELVVERNGRPIASHFPCTLIKSDDRLVVKYVKVSGPKQPMAPLESRIKSLNDIVEFNVVTKGGKNIAKILKNPALRSRHEVTVYGYKGEKVKHALKRDGRFLNSVFERTCALSELNSNVELSNIVDDLGGKTFEIIMLNKNCPPERQSSSLESHEIDSSSNDDDDDDNHNHNHKENDTNVPGLRNHVINKIPGSTKLRSDLASRVNVFIKGITTEISRNRKVSDMRTLCVEYSKSQDCFSAKAMKMIMTSLIDSVCQVRINGRAVGSGFLLFNTFVLTNFHVIQKIYNSDMHQLLQTVTVDFSFESLEQDRVRDTVKEVQEVAAYEYNFEGSIKHDWALLSLTTDPTLPPGLLVHCGFPSESGRICISGHPGGVEKKVDINWIIPVHHRNTMVERHYNENLRQFETHEVIQFVGTVVTAVNNTKDLLYETCFYGGSSGSPVFDIDCNVVAMHSGGYAYEDTSGEMKSIIEYGHPMVSILENLYVKLVHSDRLDVLKQLLEVPYKHHLAIKHNVKKLVESRNYTKFKNIANTPDVMTDDTLRNFFEIICEIDSSTPMDISFG